MTDESGKIKAEMKAVFQQQPAAQLSVQKQNINANKLQIQANNIQSAAKDVIKDFSAQNAQLKDAADAQLQANQERRYDFLPIETRTYLDGVNLEHTEQIMDSIEISANQTVAISRNITDIIDAADNFTLKIDTQSSLQTLMGQLRTLMNSINNNRNIVSNIISSLKGSDVPPNPNNPVIPVIPNVVDDGNSPSVPVTDITTPNIPFSNAVLKGNPTGYTNINQADIPSTICAGENFNNFGTAMNILAERLKNAAIADGYGAEYAAKAAQTFKNYYTAAFNTVTRAAVLEGNTGILGNSKGFVEVGTDFTYRDELMEVNKTSSEKSTGLHVVARHSDWADERSDFGSEHPSSTGLYISYVSNSKQRGCYCDPNILIQKFKSFLY